jgi:Flp pilus assembly protein TadB
MTFDALKQNIQRIKEILREMYIFTNQLETIKHLERDKKILINFQEKKLLINTIVALGVQLNILNNSIPDLIEGIGFFQRLSTDNKKTISAKIPENNLVKVEYKTEKTTPPVSLTIGEKDRQLFLENLSASNLSINQLKKKYGIERPISGFGKPNFYATLSNRYFRKTSTKLVSSGKLEKLNADLRKMNSPFVVGTYVSMILFTMSVAVIFSILLFIILLFFNIGFTFPFFSLVNESTLLRALKVFWVIFAIPIFTGILMYFYPQSESKNIGAKIDQELPFVAIHMSAIAASGVEPVSIFKVIIKNEEYRYSRLEFRKLLNLINFQGADLVNALKRVSNSSPSTKLRELLDGLATTINSGGELHGFLEKHADTLLFDYKIEREKYTKTAETFMDIYISIVIAAPMILLMLFVIMGSTGMYFMGLTTNLMSVLIIFIIIVLNIGFLVFLRLKQPSF